MQRLQAWIHNNVAQDPLDTDKTYETNRSLNILLVEETRIGENLLILFLERRDIHKVHTTWSATEAARRVTNGDSFDLILVCRH